MEGQEPIPIRGWARMQRRVRRLAPAPVRKADLAVFRAVARTKIPVLGPLLPRLSHAANHSRLWMAVALGLGIGGGRFGRRAGVRGMVAVGLTSALTNLPAKLLAGRTRPDITPVPFVRHLARLPTSTSFPSGHSASAFAFAAGAGLELPEMRPLLYPLAAAVAGSRVYTGVHYPGDVLVGSAIGAAVARATTRSWPLADHAPAEGADAGELDLGEDGEGLVIVANAGAGTRLGHERADALRRALPGARILQAEPGEDLWAALRRACAAATVLGVAGGDGSASAAAAVAHEMGRPLAVIPTGTLNHLASQLGMDGLDGSVAAVRRRRAIAMDVGDIDGRPFVNVARIGAFAEIVRERERWEGMVGRWPAALWALIKVLVAHQPTALEIDGRPTLVWMVFVGNCTFDPRGIAPSQRARLDDGLLDVRVVRADLPWARTRVLWALLTGRLHRCVAVQRWLAQSLEVRSTSGPMTLAADGEVFHGSAAVTVRKRAQPLVVLQGAQDAGSPE